jgi:hypothetical protein
MLKNGRSLFIYLFSFFRPFSCNLLRNQMDAQCQIHALSFIWEKFHLKGITLLVEVVAGCYSLKQFC